MKFAVNLLILAMGVWVARGETELIQATARASELMREGRLAEAVALLRPAVDMAKSQGNGGIPLATAWNNLGSIHHSAGQGREAMIAYREAISILEGMGNAGGAIVAPLVNLGVLRASEGRFDEAEKFHVRALGVITDTFGARSPELGVTLNGLAEVSIKRQRFSEGERYLLRAIEALEGIEGTARHLAMAHYWLSSVRSHEKRTAEAESLLRRAIVEWEGSIGRAHPTYAAAITQLATLISKTNPEEAERLFRAALDYRERQLGPDHPEAGRVLEAYARLLRARGRKQEAKRLAERAERIAHDSSSEDISRHIVDVSELRPAGRD